MSRFKNGRIRSAPAARQEREFGRRLKTNSWAGQEARPTTFVPQFVQAYLTETFNGNAGREMQG
jgi:hypothetical protein